MTRIPLVLWLLTLGTSALAQEAPQVEAVLSEARAAELPVLPLEAKAREGAAKGVPPERVASVLADLVRDWEAAATLLGDRADAADRDVLVPAAAAALRQGADGDSVRSLAAGEHGAAALQALSDVLYAGLSPTQADRVVAAAVATDDVRGTLIELPQATRLLLATGTPTQTVTSLTGALSQGATPLAAVPTDKGGPPGHSNAGGSDKSKGKGKTK
jgi:hypothetical protein